jgi:hypothetical protein
MAKFNLAVAIFVLGIGTAFASSPMPKASALAQAKLIISSMDENKNSVQNLVINNKDLIKSLCLKDKLQQINTAIESAQTIISNLDSIHYKENDVLAQHELDVLISLSERTNQFNKEADLCIGLSDLNMQYSSASVSSTIDFIMPDDLLQYPINSLIIEPPACSSCFK